MVQFTANTEGLNSSAAISTEKSSKKSSLNSVVRYPLFPSASSIDNDTFLEVQDSTSDEGCGTEVVVLDASMISGDDMSAASDSGDEDDTVPVDVEAIVGDTSRKGNAVIEDDSQGSLEEIHEKNVVEVEDKNDAYAYALNLIADAHADALNLIADAHADALNVSKADLHEKTVGREKLEDEALKNQAEIPDEDLGTGSNNTTEVDLLQKTKELRVLSTFWAKDFNTVTQNLKKSHSDLKDNLKKSQAEMHDMRRSQAELLEMLRKSKAEIEKENFRH